MEGSLAVLVSHVPPCVLFEDEHLLVVNKPAGINTHAPAPFASEGIYDWLRHREPRWASLAILHRLDKETSGLIAFPKTRLANQSLAQQFADRSIRKTYLLLTDRTVPSAEFSVRSHLIRVGDHYASGPGPSGVEAETRFRLLEGNVQGQFLVRAQPITGRTHQIRVHAAEQGFPILGDRLYGGTGSGRVCLHAAELILRHPATGLETVFTVAPDFDLDSGVALRQAIVEPELTDSYRLIHGAADGFPGWYLDRFGDFLLSATPQAGQPERQAARTLECSVKRSGIRGVFHKTLTRQPGAASTPTSPQLVQGESPPPEFTIRENGVRFELSFQEGYSVGLFLDQRDNRRRLLTSHVAAGFPLFANGTDGVEVLNVFAYTCAFSVCSARAGARTTSLDLSKKYLEWGQRNFRLNNLDPAAHDFIYGDAFSWMKRLAKKQRHFDLILLDPPTFSRSKEHGTFQAEQDYPRLVQTALPLLKPNGVLFVSTNAATWEPELFLNSIAESIRSFGRRIIQQHYVPQPPDFPANRDEPAYLKTAWLRVAG